MVSDKSIQSNNGHDRVPSLMAQRFRGYLPVVVDVECGGFNAKTDAILEIAAVMLQMNNQDVIYPDTTHFYHVKPFDGANVEQSAIEFTGINPYHPLRIAQAEDDVFRELFKLIRKAQKYYGCTRTILVGHNASFDQGFVNAAIERHKLKRNPFHPFSSFDTASLAGLAYGQTVLAKACESAGIEFNKSDAHSAKYDAQKTAELFCGIVNRWKNLGGWPLK